MRGLATHYSNIFGLVVDRNSTCRRRILSATILPPQKGHWEKGADEPSLKQGSSGWIPTRRKEKRTVLFVLLSHCRWRICSWRRRTSRRSTMWQRKQVSACWLKRYPAWNLFAARNIYLSCQQLCMVHNTVERGWAEESSCTNTNSEFN